MIDYIELKVTYIPRSQDSDDLMAAYLADEGYESFTSDEDCLTAFVQENLYDAAAVENILKEFPMSLGQYEINASRVESKDWNEEWEKNYFQPILIEGRCVVHSTFHKDIPEAEYEILIDPKMAFGTGHHATTSMMLRFLLEEDLAGKSVIDMGSGTGILSILAAKRGAMDVAGVEIDPGACRNAEENIALNGVDVAMLEGDSSRLAELPVADIFIANINRNVILADLKRYADALKPGGVMLLSGFYDKDVPLIERAASLYGLTITDRKFREADNSTPENPELWTALRLKR